VEWVIIGSASIRLLRYEQNRRRFLLGRRYGSFPSEERAVPRIHLSLQPTPEGRSTIRALDFYYHQDDRVGPVHARKFAARWRSFTSVLLLRESSKAGITSGGETEESAETNAVDDIYLTPKVDGLSRLCPTQPPGRTTPDEPLNMRKRCPPGPSPLARKSMRWRRAPGTPWT